MVFGYGHLTWEWVEGIRSYLHPCFFAIIFCILKWTALDFTDVVVITPSHLHLPIQMRILECLPNLNEDNLTYQEEDKIFFENPHKWLQLNIDISHYDHLVLYEGLIEHVETYLEVNSFLLCRKFWHTHFPDVRTSQYILIYCR